MKHPVAKLIADLELIIKAYPKVQDPDKRKTMELAYGYRLGQLSEAGTPELYRQYKQHYLKMGEQG